MNIVKIKTIIAGLLRKINFIIPRNKKLWVFGSWEGKLFSDNSKYMYEYVINNHPEIRSVWITKSKQVLNKLRKSGHTCYLNKSIMGIWFIIHAGAAFETEGESDISFLLNEDKTKVIQLWHGMGAKAMRWKTDKGADMMTQEGVHWSSYNWIATSQLYINTMSDLLRIKKERFQITGYPRNDTFVSCPINENMEKLKDQNKDGKFIIYMPTHRNFGKEGNEQINIDQFKIINEALKKENIFMVYKPHFHELKNFLQYEDEFSNIILAKDPEVWGDPYAYLHYFDLMISDYSSVLTDFMCSGKPVIVFAYDIEDYVSGDAGLNDYFWTLQGGPLCKTWDETLGAAIKLLREDTWKNERERCRQQYHLYNDGRNCERVYDYVLKVLNK